MAVLNFYDDIKLDKVKEVQLHVEKNSTTL